MSKPFPGPPNPTRPGETLLPFTATLDPPQAYLLGPAEVHEVDMAETALDLHPDLPPVPVWGFGVVGDVVSSPGPLLETETDQPALVRWHNRLPASVRPWDPDQQPPARLPIATAVLQDKLEPSNSVQNYLGAGDGQPEDLSMSPIGWTTVHLHGAHAPSDADGWPDNMAATGADQVSRYTNTYDNTDLGLAKAGEFLWYHDHAMNGTRYHNYSGLAGPYLIRDPRERELGLPVTRDDGEIVLMLQDRNLDLGADGQLRLLHKTTTDTAEAFEPLTLVGGRLWPRLPLRPDVYRLRLLNASNARAFRLHLVSVRHAPDGSVTVTPQHQRVLVIGTGGGLLWQAWHLGDNDALTLASAERLDVLVDLTGLEDGEQLTFVNSAPAPFQGQSAPVGKELDELVAGGDWANRIPYPWVMRFDIDSRASLGGAPGELFAATENATLNPVYRRLTSAADHEVEPESGPVTMPVTDANVTTILLAETPSPGHLYLQQIVRDDEGKIAIQFPGEDKPYNYRVYQWMADDTTHSEKRVSFYDRIALRPMIGQWQIFRFVNCTGDTHPMHIHLSQFQPLGVSGALLNVQYGPADNPADRYDPTTRSTGENLPLVPNTDPSQHPRFFEPTETGGWKDVIRIDPGNVVQVAGRFDMPGRYVYHCHILEHEDTEMMQPLVVTVNKMTDGQPMSMH